MAEKKRWIQAIGMKKGALTAQAAKEGKSPMTFAAEHKHDPGTTGKRSRLALTLRGFRHALRGKRK
jgi:hypothetical protein